MRTHGRPLLVLPILIGGMLAGCGAGASSSNIVTVESRSIATGAATSTRVDISMQPGNLQMRGGAGHLLDARFTYRPTAWKPLVSYRVEGNRGTLVIRQPQLESVKNGKNGWNLALSDRVPIDLHVTSGPGNATLNLRSLNLRSLSATVGAGNLTIDAGSPSLRTIDVSAAPGNLTVNLAAPWKHDVVATIAGGIGNTTVHLPSSVGVQVRLRHGAGVVTAPGFKEHGRVYVNDAYGHSKACVRVSLTTGIGNVVLASQA